jgi:COMPASS component SWD2
MRITREVLESMGRGKVFKENRAKINAIDFYQSGEYLVTSSDDESVILYDVNAGKKHKALLSKKYGVDLIRFAHNPQSVICASKNGWEESLRYWSLHDNRYIRYFKGHRDRVVSLAMNPVNDTFISASLDNTIRLWDLNTNVCQGLLRRKGRPAVSFDPQGIIFAAATSVNQIKLYDLRSYDKGPFSSFTLNHATVEFTGMKFSPDGKYILLSTTGESIFLMDSFNGELKQTYTGFVNASALSLEASFTPDGQFVLAGSEDGTVHIWETFGKQVAVWKGHTGPVQCVQFNPKTMMAATADTNLAFWITPN